jgi:hypothetical protein
MGQKEKKTHMKWHAHQAKQGQAQHLSLNQAKPTTATDSRPSQEAATRRRGRGSLAQVRSRPWHARALAGAPRAHLALAVRH